MKLPDRAAMVDRLAACESTDVLIVGGGINGAGLFRELAINGVTAVLIDKNDFASGATAASSRMIHGGLRYLENGEFGLVRESIAERDRLLRNAPHAVEPLPTTIPVFSRWSGYGGAVKRLLGFNSAPQARGLWLIRIGLCIYDLITLGRRLLPKHYIEGRGKALSRRPAMRTDIIATATYHDAMIALPERLCLELIDDAIAHEAQAIALNYCALTGAANGAVTVTDVETGRNFQLRPKIVVNATGAWIDFANAALNAPSRLIGGTKGSHLVIDHPELMAAVGDHQIFYENPDGRICILFKLNDRVLAGSTDLRIDNADDAVCSQAEQSYILGSIRTVFPNIDVTDSHIVSRFCGVRPLPASNAGATAQISRDHQIIVSQPTSDSSFSILSMVGGKWTTFRVFGEQAADQILQLLGMRRQASSRNLPIGGHSPAPEDDDIIAVANACQTEAVVHLDDLLLRRTAIGLFRPPDASGLAQLAEIAARALGWDASRTKAEIERTRLILVRRHGVDIGETQIQENRNVQVQQASA